MISYQQYLDFEAGRIDMYDVAVDSDGYYFEPSDNTVSYMQIEQYAYEMFQKCDAAELLFTEDENNSVWKVSADGRWIGCHLLNKNEWNWDSFFENAVNLRFLFVKGYDTTIPDRIFKLKKLIHLDLERCNIGKGLEKVDYLASLQLLALDECDFEALPDNIGNLKELIVLSFVGAKTGSIPQALGRLRNLRYLNAGGNEVTEIPKEIFQMSELRHLQVRLPKLKELSEEIEKLSNLEQLVLWGSKFSVLPECICDFEKLEDLNLYGMKNLQALPDNIGNLRSLQTLDISRSGILQLPDSFGKLNQLEKLDLSGTCIRRFPQMLPFDNLKFCNLMNMTLERIPRQLLNYKMEIHVDDFSADGLQLADTRILCQPISLFRHDYAFIDEYYTEEKIHLNETKVVFLGDGEAGKSHIIERIKQAGESLRGFSKEATPGIAISEQHYMVENENICLQIWDFGGQEIMHSMHRFFLTDRTLYVIVVNARDNTQDERAQYWLNNIKSFANGCPVILVLNKVDQNPSASINERLLKDDYPQIINTLKMSALMDSREQFNLLSESILNAVKEFDSYAMEFPVSWNHVKRELSDMGANYIEDAQYRSICRSNKIEDEQIQDWLLDWFHDLGVSFNYRKMDQLLGGYMVLKPQWITNAIYIILFNGREYARNGIIGIEKIIALLKKPPKSVENITYDIGEVPYIMGVMRRFEISYSIDARNEFIPMMCDRNQHVEAERFVASDESLEYWMEYDYLPNNVLHKLMIKMRDDLSKEKIWLTGMILEPENSALSALVRMHNKRIEIFVQSRKPAVYSPKEYLGEIRRYLLKINQDLNLKSEDMIVYKEGNLREVINYTYLLKHLSADKNSYFSAKYGKDIPISSILGMVEKEYDIELILKFCSENKEITYPRLQGMLMEWERRSVTHEKLMNDLLENCVKLQGNTLEKLQGKENDRNTYIRDLLRTQKYNVSDQTLNGTSPGGKSAGELDLLIKNRQDEPFAVLEALNLDSLREAYLAEHINKLYDYDTWGLACNYLLSYVGVQDFADFCGKYYIFIKNFAYPYVMKRVTESDISQYTDIRIFETLLSRNEKDTKIVHILVKI